MPTTTDSTRQGQPLDARSLRGLAHPLRLRILGLLREDGPATASGLAARLGESSGSTSWHLRQLAEYGFIEEDPDRGNRRDRWWRARHEVTVFDKAQFLDDPDSWGALQVLMHEVVNRDFGHAAAFVAAVESWRREWVCAATLSDWDLRLTAPELTRLVEELGAVIERYRRPRAEGDEAVRVQLQAFPRNRHEEQQP
ncbi:winged helix-turn-helix domain-containing protein [Allokutzneria albata]|uniref:Helix-turn-helix domain-containing protein n=1 Tax=Allokutzneria albata TaxID=211114 RepID=A0A1G9RCI1_ALLAB|nr:winged helix-turn-helix domain-containing protein [Allokutzneria albata]SDM20861.1 Helix-turn-helix domain-containing protein [Allokutzneria albata]